MKNTTTRLKSAIRNIADAEDMYQAKTTMNQLSHLLGLKSVTASARKKALLMLRQSMRAIILSHAEAHYIANQALYPSYVRVLLEEIEKLKKYYNTPEAEESDIMRYLELPGFDAIGEKTIKNILAFLTQTHTAFADNPELRMMVTNIFVSFQNKRSFFSTSPSPLLKPTSPGASRTH